MPGAIAELKIDVKGARAPMRLAIYKPRWVKRMRAWGCRYSFSRPLGRSQVIYGVDSMQALTLALKMASVTLYSSDLYKQKKLGRYGKFGGDLSLPASYTLLDIAPYPF